MHALVCMILCLVRKTGTSHTTHTHTQHTHTFLWISIHPSIQPNTPFSTVTGIWYFHVVLLWTLVDYRRNKNQYDTMNAISIQATFYIHNIMYLTWASMAEEIVKQTLPSMYIYIYIYNYMYAVLRSLAFTSKSQSHFGTALRYAMFCVLTILKLCFGVFCLWVSVLHVL